MFLLHQVISYEIIFLSATKSCTWRRTRLKGRAHGKARLKTMTPGTP